MKQINQALTELGSIIENNIKNYMIPHQEGKTIRISNVVIRPSKRYGYIVVDITLNKTVATTFSKIAAIAVAKSYLKSNNFQSVLNIDNILEKNYNDCKFYNHVIKSNNNNANKDSILIRMEVSKQKIESATKSLDDIILGDMR
jgi:hypothetical protein